MDLDQALKDKYKDIDTNDLLAVAIIVSMMKNLGLHPNDAMRVVALTVRTMIDSAPSEETKKMVRDAVLEAIARTV